MKFRFSKGATNQHGTQKLGEPWNRETVTGQKIVFLNLKTEANPKPMAKFYWRFVVYFPSGACWYIDMFSRRKVSR